MQCSMDPALTANTRHPTKPSSAQLSQSTNHRLSATTAVVSLYVCRSARPTARRATALLKRRSSEWITAAGQPASQCVFTSIQQTPFSQQPLADTWHTHTHTYTIFHACVLMWSRRRRQWMTTEYAEQTRLPVYTSNVPRTRHCNSHFIIIIIIIIINVRFVGRPLL